MRLGCIHAELFWRPGCDNAKAQCLFTLCAGPGKEVRVFDGRTEGKIVEARGPKDGPTPYL